MSLFGGTTVPVRSLLFVVIMFACTHMRTTIRAQRSRCSHEGHQTHADTPREMPSGAHSLSVVSSVATPAFAKFSKDSHKVPKTPKDAQRAFLSDSNFFSRSQWILEFSTSHFSMSQCGCLKPNPAHGRWWVGSALRSQHNIWIGHELVLRAGGRNRGRLRSRSRRGP